MSMDGLNWVQARQLLIDLDYRSGTAAVAILLATVAFLRYLFSADNETTVPSYTVNPPAQCKADWVGELLNDPELKVRAHQSRLICTRPNPFFRFRAPVRFNATVLRRVDHLVPSIQRVRLPLIERSRRPLKHRRNGRKPLLRKDGGCCGHCSSMLSRPTIKDSTDAFHGTDSSWRIKRAFLRRHVLIQARRGSIRRLGRFSSRLRGSNGQFYMEKEL